MGYWWLRITNSFPEMTKESMLVLPEEARKQGSEGA
jgi:hypothetical protein